MFCRTLHRRYNRSYLTISVDSSRDSIKSGSLINSALSNRPHVCATRGEVEGSDEGEEMRRTGANETAVTEKQAALSGHY